MDCYIVVSKVSYADVEAKGNLSFKQRYIDSFSYINNVTN